MKMTIVTLLTLISISAFAEISTKLNEDAVTVVVKGASVELCKKEQAQLESQLLGAKKVIINKVECFFSYGQAEGSLKYLKH